MGLTVNLATPTGAHVSSCTTYILRLISKRPPRLRIIREMRSRPNLQPLGRYWKDDKGKTKQQKNRADNTGISSIDKYFDRCSSRRLPGKVRCLKVYEVCLRVQTHY